MCHFTVKAVKILCGSSLCLSMVILKATGSRWSRHEIKEGNRSSTGLCILVTKK